MLEKRPFTIFLNENINLDFLRTVAFDSVSLVVRKGGVVGSVGASIEN